MRIGALEAGGTKMVCAVGREDGTILEQMSIPTTTPEETIPKIISYFKEKDICALGVAAFGPVDVDPRSDTYGYILDTPKLGTAVHLQMVASVGHAIFCGKDNAVPIGFQYFTHECFVISLSLIHI